MTLALMQELPPNIRLHRAVLKPRGVQICHTQNVTREYGYFVPLDVLGGDVQRLREILQQFAGEHCFANFTELKKLEGLKKKIQRSPELQAWAHGLQSWKRERREASYSTVPISGLRVHRAMRAACERTIMIVEVEHVPGTKLACIRMRGEGFLYNMVRYIAGSSLAVHSGKLPSDTLQAALSGVVAVDLSEYLAPAVGLVLLGQYIDAPWTLQNSQEAETSAEDFMMQQLLPAIANTWEMGGAAKKPFAAGDTVFVVVVVFAG